MTVTRNIVKQNFSRDSVQMMLLTRELKNEEGAIEQILDKIGG